MLTRGLVDKFEIVVQGNMHKFTVSEEVESLSKWLLATGDRELVEAATAEPWKRSHDGSSSALLRTHGGRP